MILVLGIGGLLRLPETGYQLYVRPGDVIFLWTDKLAVQSAKPSQYIIESDAEDETDDENGR